MTKSELESKHLAELHALAAEAGVPRYRMLRREELVEKLAAGDTGAKGESKPREKREPSRQQQRQRGGRDGESRERAERRDRPERRERSERQARSKPESKPETPAPRREERAEPPAGESRQPRRRRRRRFGRKRKELRLHDLLVGTAPGRQTIVYAETRAACTTLLREFAAELAGASNGPDPVVLLVDPGPEELAEWRREAPRAEIVAAAQARHAEDALAQAVRRAESDEDVIVLVDSLTRLAELSDVDAAKNLLDAAGSLAVVAALERPA